MSINKHKDNSWMCTGDSVLVSYFKDTTDKVKGKQLHFCGFHTGEITGNNIEVLDYKDVNKLFADIEKEKILVSSEQAEEIISNDEKNQKVKLTKEQKDRIRDYAKNDSI